MLESFSRGEFLPLCLFDRQPAEKPEIGRFLLSFFTECCSFTHYLDDNSNCRAGIALEAARSPSARRVAGVCTRRRRNSTTTRRRQTDAFRQLEQAINLYDLPEKITIDKSGANTAAIESVKADACVDILMRQNKYLNNIVEQDHRAIKRITRPMLGFKSFWSAQIIIAGIETMHMIRKGQMDCLAGRTMSAAQQFYSLAV